MKPALAILGILSFTFAAASEFVVLAVYRWGFLGDAGGAEFAYGMADVASVFATLAWWTGGVLVGFATMVRDRRALQIPSVGSQGPTSS